MMADSLILTAKRLELKRKMGREDDRSPRARNGDVYRSLGGIILYQTGYVVHSMTQPLWRLFKRTPSARLPAVGYSAAVVALVTLLTGFVASLLAGEKLSLAEVQLCLWAAVIGAATLVENKWAIGMFLDTFRESTLDAIESASDLEALEQWLDHRFRPIRSVRFGAPVGLLVGLLLYGMWNRSHQQPIHVGPIVTVMLASFQIAVVIYYIYPFFVVLPRRLSHVRYRLYKADPSSSEVVERLSDLFTKVVYITVGFVVVATVSLAYLQLLTLPTSLFLAVMVWVPAVALIVGSQLNLSHIISRTKWETLEEIQITIEALRVREEVPWPETLDHLAKLMDLHDRIRETPNSALNLRAGLNVVNSLLIPLLAFVLANVDRVAAFVRWLQERLTTP
jgi:hypothetical protein